MMGLTNTESIIVLVVVVLFLVLVAIFNKIVILKNKIKQSKSSIDIYLNQRFDLIPNLVEVVKNYKEYEQETLAKITEMRNQFKSNKSLDLGKEINVELNRMIGVAEGYPDLKANEQYTHLFNALQNIESQLQAARRIYNGDVTMYNNAIQTFPNNLFASLFGFKEEKLFEVEEYKKENIKMDI